MIESQCKYAGAPYVACFAACLTPLILCAMEYLGDGNKVKVSRTASRRGVLGMQLTSDY